MPNLEDDVEIVTKICNDCGKEETCILHHSKYKCSVCREKEIKYIMEETRKDWKILFCFIILFVAFVVISIIWVLITCL